jgi:hypothetical protein
MSETSILITFLLRKNEYDFFIDKKILTRLKDKVVKNIKVKSFFGLHLPPLIKILFSPGNVFIKKNTFALQVKKDSEKLKNIFPEYEIIDDENTLRFVKDTNIENLQLKLGVFYGDKKLENKDAEISIEIEFNV